MNKKIRCPICNEEINKSGLKGHLRFKHQLSGKELTKIWQEGKEGAIHHQEQVTKLEQIKKLHNRLREIQENRKLLEEEEGDDLGNIIFTNKAVNKLKKLYDIEEKRIEKELDKLLQEMEIEKESDWLDDLLP